MEKEFKYRLDRINKLSLNWNGIKKNKLLVSFKIPDNLLKTLELNVMLFVSRAINVQFKNEESFIKDINNNMIDLTNITPNGGVVPKKEYQLEYNLVLKSWHDIFENLSLKDSNIIHRIRSTPSIRIKIKDELKENVSRPLRTNLPHSDAWVDGRWGLNIHIPLLGDTENNRLRYFDLIDEDFFKAEMLQTSNSFENMQHYLKFFKVNETLKAEKGTINISDYLLIHQTWKVSNNCGARVSIDSSIIIGNHPEKDDHTEYVKELPEFGIDTFCHCPLSITTKISDKTSKDKHYSVSRIQKID